MSRAIRLVRYEVDRVKFYYLKSWRMRIAAEEGVNQDDLNIFVYKQLPYDPYVGDTTAVFNGVASPYEMEAFPIGAPPSDGSSVFFRQSFCDIVLPSLTEADAAWQDIKSQVDHLMSALDILDELSAMDSAWVGTLDTEDSGGSSSQSSVSTSQSLSTSESVSA